MQNHKKTVSLIAISRQMPLNQQHTSSWDSNPELSQEHMGQSLMVFQYLMII